MATSGNETYLSANAEHVEQPEELFSSRTSIQNKQSENEYDKDIFDKNEDFPTFTLKDLTLSILYVCTISTPKEVWDALRRFFEEKESMDTETNHASKVIYGNYYQNPQDCSFLVSVGKMEDSEHSVVDLRRLNGDAFLATQLFEAMKIHLSEEEEIALVEDNSEDLSESDSENFEEEDNTTKKNKIIDFENAEVEFEYDPDLLELMIKEFEKSKLEAVFENKRATMSMLAYASDKEQNRKFMMGEKWLERIKKLVRAELGPGEKVSDAALTRNTCVFLKNMVEDMEIDLETLKCVIKTMAKWCPGQKDSGSHIGCLQSSRQVLVEVDEIFQNISENSPFDDDEIEKIVKEELTTLELEQISEYVSRSHIEFGSGVLAELQATS